MHSHIMIEKGKSFFDKLAGSLKPETGNEGGAESRRINFNQPKEETPASPQRGESPKTESGSAKTWMEQAQEGELVLDVYQTPQEIVIKSTVAGVMPEDLDITITDDMVTVKGTRKKEEEVAEDNYFYQECYWGSFSRSVILPQDVAGDRAEASLKNGILTIRLPKIKKEEAKKIKVKGTI